METLTIEYQIDRLLTEFMVDGYPASHGFTMEWNPKAKKMVSAPNPKLQRWQWEVEKASRAAMGYCPPYTGNVLVRMIFAAKPRNGEACGSPWTTDVAWDRKTGKAKKQDVEVPDVDNLVKAALDGMGGVVLADDVNVAVAIGEKVYGPIAGLKVEIYAM